MTLREGFEETFPVSRKLFERAQAVIPGGIAHTPADVDQTIEAFDKTLALLKAERLVA